MFDLDVIEKDWLDHSFRLSEEDIIEIYRLEDVTLSKYCLELEEYQKKKHPRMSFTLEEMLFQTVFGERKKPEENESNKEMKTPSKKRLSPSSQKKVIEGSLYLVFDSTRNWYHFFEGMIPMEKLYYICLESLMSSVKYMLHCEKPVFGLYVERSIEKSIVKYVSRCSHRSYHETYEIIHNYSCYTDLFFKNYLDTLKENFVLDNREVVESPAKMVYLLREESEDIDYIRDVSSDEFMNDYRVALNHLDEISKIVMQLSFDINGYRGLTNAEIADYLMIEAKKVSNIRKNAVKTLKKDKKLNTYL